ncbi:MAG TPA: arsenate reductase ArsC [Bacteroidales bacterium]|nr:arsenate reductase ArsC [Bacteroidales bacterium]
MKRILILCTGNSARSQMAEGIMRSLSDGKLEIFSAGTKPADKVHPMAIEVMKEIGIDISTHHPKSVDQFLDESFDLVITVCDSANESCPFFSGDVKQRIHMGFEDPAAVVGDKEVILASFRSVRDQINEAIQNFITDL